MRVVLDTNILISACWTPGGNEARVLALVADGTLVAGVSDTLEAEYREVAGRKKFVKHREALEAAVQSLLAVAVSVTPESHCLACSDPDDNQLLDCAAAMGARFVITGNLKHFPVEWEGIQVINARGLLDRLNP